MKYGRRQPCPVHAGLFSSERACTQVEMGRHQVERKKRRDWMLLLPLTKLLQTFNEKTMTLCVFSVQYRVRVRVYLLFPFFILFYFLKYYSVKERETCRAVPGPTCLLFSLPSFLLSSSFDFHFIFIYFLTSSVRA